MPYLSDLRTIRRRQADLRDDLDALPAPSVAAAQALLVQVFQETTLPTDPLKYYACHPVTPGGAEKEGAVPTYTVDDSQTLYVAFLGGKAPAAGENYVARLLGGRWVAERGGGSKPCGMVCVKAISSCQGNPPIVGATVALSYQGTPVGTCVTQAGEVSSITPRNGGSGYTPGTGYPLSFTGGGGSGAAGLFDVTSGGIVFNERLTANGAGYTTAPTIGFESAGPGTGASAIAGLATQCCIPVTQAAGSGYTAVVSAPGYATGTINILSVGCAGGSLTLDTITLTKIGYDLTICLGSPCDQAGPGCPGSGSTTVVPGMAVTISGAASGTGTTGADGKVTFFGVPFGTVNIDVPAANNFQAFSTSITVAASGGCAQIVPVTLTPATHCLAWLVCLFPPNPTLTITDPVYGAVGVQFYPSGGPYGLANGVPAWVGFGASAPYPAGAFTNGVTQQPCPAGTATLIYAVSAAGGINVYCALDHVTKCPQAGGSDLYQVLTVGTLNPADMLSCHPALDLEMSGSSVGPPFYPDDIGSRTWIIQE